MARQQGRLRLGGGRGTYFWIDPAEQVIGIILMQTRVLRLRTEFPNVVYTALE